MGNDLNSKPLNSPFEPDKKLLKEFESLWAEADEIWEKHQEEPAFGGYVSADYLMVYEWLVRLKERASTFLEWGSGLGVVTCMASRLGFEAYGIEAESLLVDYSESFARRYAPRAQFAPGSFIPEDFEWNLAEGDEVHRTLVDVEPGYNELEMDLRDFDLVYVFPWPDEHTLFRNIMRDLGRRDALLLSYDAREGMEVTRFDGRR